MRATPDGDAAAQQKHKEAKKKPQRPPKPGTKRAQALTRAVAAKSVNSDDDGVPFTHTSVAITCTPEAKVAEETTEATFTILVLVFDTAASLANALGRAHTAYEGQALRGPLCGVNMPTTHYLAWVAATPDRNHAEQLLLQTITHGYGHTTDNNNDNDDDGNYVKIPATYIVASIKGDRSTLLHEWAHARYHLDASYRHTCMQEWTRLDTLTRQAIQRELVFRRYRLDVVVDEFQAYVVERPGEFGKKWVSVLCDVHRGLKAVVGSPPIV